MHHARACVGSGYGVFYRRDDISFVFVPCSIGKFLGMLLFLLFFFWISIGKFLGIFPFFFSRNMFFSFASKHVSSTSIVSCIHILDSVNILG